VRIGRLRALLVDAPIRWLGAGAGVVALAISGLFGGLDKTQTSGLPTVAANVVDAGTPWNVTVSGARLVDDLPPLHLERAGDRWVAVVATVEVTADESRNDLDEVVRITGVSGLLGTRPSGVYLLRDDTRLGYLHPGLPEKVAFVWEQTGSQAVPTLVEVEIWGKTHRVGSLSGSLGWFDPAPRARVAIPVEDRRAAR
jgi:hypothetical protein